MLKNILLLTVAFGFISCATLKAPQTKQLIKNSNNLNSKVILKDVPFVAQSQNYCGPASLAMIMKNLNYNVDMKALASQMYTPGQEGSLPSDVLSTTRRAGLMGIEINTLELIVKEIEDKNPVLVFQNLGFSWYPTWHYAVVVGYDLPKEEITLHTGPDKFKKINLKEFERSWMLGGAWALVVLNPGELSNNADELSHVVAAAGLEAIGKTSEAENAYLSILEKWDSSLGSLIGLGNIYYSSKDFDSSIKYLKKATQNHPNSSIAWHNLATAQGAANKTFEAKSSTKKALSVASPQESIVYKESLKQWLD